MVEASYWLLNRACDWLVLRGTDWPKQNDFVIESVADWPNQSAGILRPKIKTKRKLEMKLSPIGR